MLSVRDIQGIECRRKEVKKELYKTILESFSKKIKSQVEIGQNQAFLSVPQFVVGFPMFDRETARKYLARQLKKLGYSVIPYQSYELYVSWKKEPKKPPEPEIGLPAFVNLHKIADVFRNKNN